MFHEKSCGAIVWRKYHGNTEILIVKNLGSENWSFPKGHVEEGETEIDTALREVLEETSIQIIIDPTFRSTVVYYPRKNIEKTVVYFTARAKNTNIIPQKGEISEAKWVEIGRVCNVLSYENDRMLMAKAKNHIAI